MPRLGARPCAPHCAPLCPPPRTGRGSEQWDPSATQRRRVLAPLWAALTAQWLRDSTLASWTFSRASEGASRAGGGSVAERWAQGVPGGHLGLLCQHQRDWEVQGVPQSIWAVVPVCEHCTHHGTWHSRGCPSWQGWRRRMGGTPGAGSASPPTGEQKEGLSTRVGGQQLLRAHWVSELPSHHSQSPGDWHSGAFPSPGAALGWHTHHTPAQDTLHFPKGGHRRVPALVVEVPAAPEAARPRRVCLHGVSQLRDTPLWGCRRGHWEMPACGIASGAHMQGEWRAGEGCRYLGTACSSRRGWRARDWHM